MYFIPEFMNNDSIVYMNNFLLSTNYFITEFRNQNNVLEFFLH